MAAKSKVAFCVQGVASPILANVYLHYVLDLWFQKKWRSREAEGDAIIVRYADNFVVGFEHKRDAERFLGAVFSHLYGVTNREDVRYVYSTFPIVEREETRTYGN